MHWRTMDEMKNAPFSSSCPQRLFEAVGRSESTIGFLTVQSQGVEDRVKTRIFMNIIGNVATSSNQATSSRIQHHPTHFTWRYYTPPTPKPPPSVNNNGTCNVATSSNQATSSRIQHHPTHSTWRYYTPPHPPICIQERPFWYSIKTEGSSKLRGTPSLEPIYIYIILP